MKAIIVQAILIIYYGRVIQINVSSYRHLAECSNISPLSTFYIMMKSIKDILFFICICYCAIDWTIASDRPWFG